MNSSDNESLDDEIKELLENYKFKKATIYEPCTLKNFKECLIGLNEEFNLLNIDYVFNPHTDVENDTLSPEALVKLINSVWTLLHHFKNVVDKVEGLEEQNHILENNNKHINDTIERLNVKLSTEKNESRACVASAQRASDQSSEIYQKLLDTKMKLNQLTKQKETNEKCLQNKIARLKLENNKILDRLRNKSDNFTPCTDICDSTLMQLKDRERKQRALIAQLQANNQDLLREVLALKEELILEGIGGVTMK
ncbi:uncharacterized protein LOC126776031 [Nymphalis io]|uniref:uncharacterized protein LOC126776031 n=1 Tax=Inachis io TaxID=171585 RepID=UPI002169BA81|nr:uncharacterized protein LOC126776031 [Nymphalis io]XP_050354255.1 uncharacterized protein LOC126776031 [Nymphalis io]